MEVNKVREELIKQYKQVPLKSNDILAFLHAMNVYVDHIQQDSLLRKIISSIKEEHVRKAIEIAQASLEFTHAQEHDDILAEAEEVDVEERTKQFPTYEYNELLRANEQFQKVKHLKTLEEIEKTVN